jgi:hypothetical protein
LAAELQYSTTYKKSTVNHEITNSLGSGLETISSSLNTLGAYAAYRSSGNLYLKAKVGYMKETYNDSSSFRISHSKNSTSDSGLAGGIGAGYKFEQSRVELEYTAKSGPMDLRYLSMGYFLSF